MMAVACLEKKGSGAPRQKAIVPSDHSVRWIELELSSGVREKYYWLTGGWKLMLKRCLKKILLVWRLLELGRGRP